MNDSKVVTNRRPPNAGKGRPKGATNKTTRTALEAIAYAADALGGADRLTEWAKASPENEKVFWGTIYPKLLPLQVTGEGGGAVCLGRGVRLLGRDEISCTGCAVVCFACFGADKARF